MNSPLKTERLLISPIVIADLENIHQLHSLPETDEFNTLGIPKNLKETEKIVQEWIENNNNGENLRHTFKIVSLAHHHFIGLIALNLGLPKFKIAETWYKLHPNFWGKGYATEALNRILKFGFNDLKLHRIEAGCAVDNIGSIRVLEKVGMTREGREKYFR